MTTERTDERVGGYHKECPKCHSKDNVYHYPDGHEFCFGRCGYLKRAPLTKDQMCALLKEKEDFERKGFITNEIDTPTYPEDAVAEIKDPGLTWLKKYGMYNEEIREHDIMWSEQEQQLIFPIYNDNFFTIAWQARNFIPNRKKYHTEGRMDEILHIVGLTKHSNPDIILVEDMVSAIKVSRYYRCMPLFGSGCSRDKLVRLRRYTDHVRFWLDSDKLGTAMKMAKTCSQLGFRTGVIHTQADPKECSNGEIEALGRG
jgi:hypothetical protein